MVQKENRENEIKNALEKCVKKQIHLIDKNIE